MPLLPWFLSMQDAEHVVRHQARPLSSWAAYYRGYALTFLGGMGDGLGQHGRH